MSFSFAQFHLAWEDLTLFYADPVRRKRYRVHSKRKERKAPKRKKKKEDKQYFSPRDSKKKKKNNNKKSQR